VQIEDAARRTLERNHGQSVELETSDFKASRAV
jgi:hypothetical protein